MPQIADNSLAKLLWDWIEIVHGGDVEAATIDLGLAPGTIYSALRRGSIGKKIITALKGKGFDILAGDEPRPQVHEQSVTYPTDGIEEMFDDLAKELGRSYSRKTRERIIELARELQREHIRAMLAGLIKSEVGAVHGKIADSPAGERADKERTAGIDVGNGEQSGRKKSKD